MVNGASAAGKTWLNDTVNWYLDPTQWKVLLAASGPANWQRIDSGQVPGKRPAGTTHVSNIKMGTDTISFDVTKVGVPVEVKASYFPNWKVSGADGPYRVEPQPHGGHPAQHPRRAVATATRASTTCSYLLTFLGLVGLVVLWRAKPVSMAPVPAMWREGEDDVPDGPPPDDPRDPAWWVDPVDHRARPPAR